MKACRMALKVEGLRIRVFKSSALRMARIWFCTAAQGLEDQPMSDAIFVLDDLNDAIARGSAESRVRALWHATDILVGGEFDEDDIRLFGEVISRLADEIEETARAELSRRLAHSDNAPPKVIRMLAFDDS